MIKCKYYMMLWRFDEEGKATLQPACELPTMHLASGTDKKQHAMTQLDCSTAHETLGAQTSPDLQTQTALQALRQKKINTQTDSSHVH